MAQRHLEHKIRDSHFKARTRDEDRRATGAPFKGETKEKSRDKTTIIPREEIVYVGLQKASVHLEKHAHSSMTQTRR